MRQCTRCGEFGGRFGKDPSVGDGLKLMCRECERSAQPAKRTNSVRRGSRATVMPNSERYQRAEDSAKGRSQIQERVYREKDRSKKGYIQGRVYRGTNKTVLRAVMPGMMVIGAVLGVVGLYGLIHEIGHVAVAWAFGSPAYITSWVSAEVPGLNQMPTLARTSVLLAGYTAEIIFTVALTIVMLRRGRLGWCAFFLGGFMVVPILALYSTDFKMLHSAGPALLWQAVTVIPGFLFTILIGSALWTLTGRSCDLMPSRKAERLRI